MAKSTGNFLTLTDAIDKFTADGMRLALADAGDSWGEDANFVESDADAALLRLYNLLQFITDLLNKSETEFPNIRTSPERTMIDEVFEAVLHQQMRSCKKHYEEKNFKMALREGVFSLISARDQYKEICGKDGVNYDLMMKYVRFQTIALAPLTPHCCEYIWREQLGNKESVTSHLWPVIHEQTEQERANIDALDFLQGTARDLRLKLRSHNQGIDKKRARGDKNVQDCPDSVNLYISDNVPQWQETILTICKNLIMKTEDKSSWPDMKAISKDLKGALDKKYMKKAMPFVAAVRDNFLLNGISALDHSCAYNQRALLEQNIRYIKPSEMDIITILDAKQAPEYVQSECGPGKPIPEWISRSSANIYMKVPQASNSMMSQYVQIFNNDNQEMLLNRLRRNDKVIKVSADKTKLFAYKDPVLGPRQIPLPLKSIANLNSWANEMALTEVDGSKSFEVFEDKNEKYVKINGKSVGEQMILIDMSQ